MSSQRFTWGVDVLGMGLRSTVCWISGLLVVCVSVFLGLPRAEALARVSHAHPRVAAGAHPRRAGARHHAGRRAVMSIASKASPRLERSRDSRASASSVAQLLNATREINYYPASAGWTEMWTNWNLPAVSADLARMHAMGANTVRIFLQPATIGYPKPSATMLTRLTQFFDAASNNGLRVHLTLFDFWDQFGDLTGSESWTRAVLSPLVGDPTLAIVELKNEIDQTNLPAMAWARTMVPFIRSVAKVPVTISVSGVSGVTGLTQLKSALGADQPDFYSFHYYGHPGLARTTLQHAISGVSPSPLFVGEFGAASTNPLGAVAGDAQQDLYLRSVVAAVKSLQLPDPAPWTLNDLTAGAIPSPTLAKDPTQYAMGLLNTNGSTKPAGTSIQQLFTRHMVDGGFNGSFEAGLDTPSSTGSLPLDWSIFDGTQAQFGRDSSVAHSGTSSVKISESGGNSAQVPSFYITPPYGWVIAGNLYRTSVWARGMNATGRNRMALAWFNSAGAYIGEDESQDLEPGTTTWSQLTISAKAPAGAAYVQIHLKSAHNAGAVWYDDVSWSG